jgi:hypothetical protein
LVCARRIPNAPQQRHPQRALLAVYSARGIFGIIEIAEDLPRPFEKHAAGG